MKRERLVAAALFALAVAAFAAAWHYPYINIDDPYYYVLPKEITGGLTWSGIKWALSDLSNAIWMPLTWIVYQADYTVRNAILGIFSTLDGFQLAYSIAHIQSILLHGVNAALFFLFLRRIDRCGASGTSLPTDGEKESARPARMAIPFIAAAIWALHPLRVESVVWIASFKDVLSMTFLLAALLLWVKYREADSMRHYVLSHIAFALACCAKPSVVTFPGMILLIDALVLGKFNPLPLDWRRYRAYLPSVAIAVPVAILAQVAQSSGGATSFQAQIPLSYRLLNALVSVGVYIRNLVWPSSLAPQCAIQWPEMPHFLSGGVVVGGAFLAIVALLAWVAYWRFQVCASGGQNAIGRSMGLVIAGALWFAGTILPMLGISAFGGHAFADRFTYIPMVGFSIALLALKSRTVAFLGAAACLCLGVAAARQTAFWRNDGALAQRILEVDGDGNCLAHVTYAKHLFDRDHSPAGLAEAERHISRGYALDPGYCQVSAVIHAFILGESGRTENLAKVEGDFIKWLRERKNIWRCLDMDVIEGVRYLYAVRREDDPEYGKKQAHKIAQKFMTLGDLPACQPYYFVYLVGKETGDKAMRQYGIDGIGRLSSPATGVDGWPSFRFVLSEDHAGKENP